MFVLMKKKKQKENLVREREKREKKEERNKTRVFINVSSFVSLAFSTYFLFGVFLQLK